MTTYEQAVKTSGNIIIIPKCKINSECFCGEKLENKKCIYTPCNHCFHEKCFYKLNMVLCPVCDNNITFTNYVFV